MKNLNRFAFLFFVFDKMFHSSTRRQKQEKARASTSSVCSPLSLSLAQRLSVVRPSSPSELFSCLYPPRTQQTKKAKCGPSPPADSSSATPQTPRRSPLSRRRTSSTPRSGSTRRCGGGRSAEGPCPCSSGPRSSGSVSTRRIGGRRERNLGSKKPSLRRRFAMDEEKNYSSLCTPVVASATHCPPFC